MGKVAFITAAAAAKSRQSCPTLRDPVDGSQSEVKSSLPADRT